MAVKLDQNNQQFQEILTELKNGDKHLLILGRAGTGKSSLLQYFREQNDQQIAVVAPTGIAAINVAGETIHHFFGFKPGTTLEETQGLATRLQSRRKTFKALQMLIIDEISMVRADLLDQVDKFLRYARHRASLPFGGVRVVMFGDLHQLPPVVKNNEDGDILRYKTPYFFSSQVFKQLISGLFPTLAYYELDQIYRQEEKTFIELLQAIRTNLLTDGQLEALNTRVVFDESELYETSQAIILTTTNYLAEQINRSKLAELGTDEQLFSGSVSGDFLRRRDDLPTAEKLVLKVGARVMFLNNDPDKRWVNGHLGTILDLVKEKKTNQRGVLVRLDHQSLPMEVFPHAWETTKTVYNPEKDLLEHQVTGSYYQLPLKLAWAVTIHKSQGKTFDEVIINLGRGAFATGQTYVALSRCTNLKGVKLTRPLNRDDVKVDPIVETFLQEIQKRCSHEREEVL